jgi:enoyl-CoA hydratase/carnithine racemase
LQDFGPVGVEAHGHVYTVEVQRPPYNFFHPSLVPALADAFEYLDQVDDCRVLVLCAQGKAFSAGADFQSASGEALFAGGEEGGADQLYSNAVRLFRTRKPVVVAVQGAAIGGGMGLALAGDFRVGCATTRFATNFVQLGIHAGFGISYTLPRIIGQQKAALMLYTGRRVGPEDALAWGLLDVVTEPENLRSGAIALAQEIAEAAPLAVESTRATLRGDIADAVEQQLQREYAEQMRLSLTGDHREGVKAVIERRKGQFSRS